jgi:hypothetical protein
MLALAVEVRPPIMKVKTVTHRSLTLVILCAAILLALTMSSGTLAAPVPGAPNAPAACAILRSAGQIPAPQTITFDDLTAGTSIGNAYQRSHGVRFEDSRTARVIAYDHPLPRSAPMTAMSQTDGDPVAVALNFYFDTAQAYVGMYMGNGGGVTTARLQVFDADENLICADEVTNVPDSHTAFIGLRDDSGRIAIVSLIYLSAQPESMDDLYFSAAAAPTAALFVSPAQAAPGGQPAVSGYGFPALADLRLILVCPSWAEFDLGAARADATGRLLATITAPAYPPNPCLLAARQDATTLADTPLTLLPALELAFAPQEGPPGTVVNFTVRNLVAGELRLDYAGRAVVGPLAVAAGSYSGSFVVPNDRPDPLGSLAELRAGNLVLGRVVGAATGSYRSQAGPTPVAYRVADLQLPGANLPPGSDFTITGRISPAPQGPLSQFQVVPVWRKADGRTLPIGREAARIAADGSFSAPVRVPSLLTGDPTWPEAGDLVGVLLLSPENGPQSFLQAIAGTPIFPTFNVKVVDAATGQLIPAAKVNFEVWQDYTVNAGSLGQLAGQAAVGISNQIGQVLGTTELTDDEKAYIALMKAICKPLTIPVNGDKWELINPTLDQTLSEPAVQGLFLANSILVEIAAAAGQDTGAWDMTTPAHSAIGGKLSGLSGPYAQSAAGEVIPYLLTVDALDVGYGLKDTNGAVKNLSLRVNFHLADLTYRDLKGNILANPYVVKLGKVSSGDQSALGPINAFVDGIGAPDLANPTGLPRFVRYHSVKNVPAGVQVTKQVDGGVQVSLSYAQFHKLGAGGMQLYVDGVWQANLAFQFNPGLGCKNGTIKWTSDPFYQGKAVIPNAHLLTPGARALQVRAQLQSGQWVNYDYSLLVDALPLSWFAVKTAGTPILNWRPGEVTLFTPWLQAGTDTQLLHSDPAKTDETGQLDNRTIPVNNITQRAEANGHKGPQISGQMRGQALNQEGQGCNLSNCPPNAAVETLHATSLQQPAADPPAGYTYGPRKENVVPKVTFDLPEVKYGIPFVAEVAGGGSVSYEASVTYQGSATVLGDGGVQSLLTIHPEALTSGTVYVEGRLLSGLIGKAGASLTANFDVHMPVTYDTAKSAPLTAGAYFKYGADFKAWHKWGCVPYVGCAYSKTYPQHLFDGCEVLAGGGGCPGAASAQSAESIAAADPPQFDLQLAASGQGAVMAIWQQTRTSLATSLFNGVAWTPAGNIATGLGSAQPQIAFLAPNRAVAVWTETNLSESQLPGLSGEDLLRAQRIAYAIWDGASWSARQPLTAPSLGEGGPALASCPAWQSGCPAGGAAIAVWERNLSANLEARAIRLYYATYQNGAWTAPQPVDNASSFTDILPQAVYANGAPLIAWVRDSDANLTDANSRRIALRFLNGGPTFNPAELPAAIAEVALAADGNGSPILAFTRLEDPARMLDNRRPLWAANVTCSGPTTCTWQPQQLVDGLGRRLYAEHPRLAVNPSGQAVITFRGVGFGGDVAPQPGDAPGMVSGAGDLAQVVTGFSGAAVTPAYLTKDGVVNWLPAAAYDPVLDATLSMAVKGQIPAGFQAQAARSPAAIAGPAPDLPIAVAALPNQPDFVLLSATPSTLYLAAGEPLTLTVRVANAGAPLPGLAETPLQVLATWDGGPGVGAVAGQSWLTEISGVAEVVLSLTPPAEGLAAARELVVTANPGLALPDWNAGNNQLALTLGGIQPPLGLWAQVQPGSSLVFLGWDAVADRRVAGYRVYRSEDGGAWQPIGGSFAPGYVDLKASVGRAYRYAVTAYAAEGGESPLSAQFSVGTRPLRIYLPLVQRGVGRQ